MRSYLEAMAEIGDPRARLVLDYGQEFQWSDLPEGEECGQAKNCYGTASMRLLSAFADTDGLRYFEGYCETGDIGIAFDHAWLVDAEGTVLELTLRHEDDRCGYCYGEGEIGVRDHWDYQQADDDDDEFDDSETVTCEMCAGSGKTKPRSLEGTTYLGVEVEADLLRRIVIEKGSFTALDGIGFEMVREALEGREAA